MSRLVILLFVCVSTFSYAQEEGSWRDSLLNARRAYENKDYAKALKHYESAQKIAPEDIDLSDEMAQSAYRSRDFERAEKIYRQGSGSKMSKSDRADAMHNLGNAQMRQKNYQGAVESYKEALRNNPNDEETRYNLSEAVREIQAQRTPPPPKPQDPKNGDPKDKGNNGKQGNQGQQGNQKDGQGQKNQSKGSQGNQSSNKNSQNKSGQGGGSSESPEGKLTNQMVERTLDELAKKEGRTKRQMMGAGAGGRSAKSGKDW